MAGKIRFERPTRSLAKAFNGNLAEQSGFLLSVHVCAEFRVTLNFPLVMSFVSYQRRYDEDSAPVNNPQNP